MNEPKRRGRPTNAEKSAREAAFNDGRTVAYVPTPAAGMSLADAVVNVIPDQKLDAMLKEAVASAVDRGSPLIDRTKAQAYALRVWSGQSPDVPRNERLRRVKLALEGQGLSMEGVVL